MPMDGVPPGILRPPEPPRADESMEDEGRKPVGTLVLAFIFLASFVLYYFVNWKLLSLVWKIG